MENAFYLTACVTYSRLFVESWARLEHCSKHQSRIPTGQPCHSNPYPSNSSAIAKFKSCAKLKHACAAPFKNAAPRSGIAPLLPNSNSAPSPSATRPSAAARRIAPAARMDRIGTSIGKRMGVRVRVTSDDPCRIKRARSTNKSCARSTPPRNVRIAPIRAARTEGASCKGAMLFPFGRARHTGLFDRLAHGRRLFHLSSSSHRGAHKGRSFHLAAEGLGLLPSACFKRVHGGSRLGGHGLWRIIERRGARAALARRGGGAEPRARVARRRMVGTLKDGHPERPATTGEVWGCPPNSLPFLSPCFGRGEEGAGGWRGAGASLGKTYP